MTTEKFQLGSEISLIEVEVNDRGDCIYIDPSDPGMFNRFWDMAKEVISLADSFEAKAKELEKGTDTLDATVEFARARLAFSDRACELIKGVFGSNVLEKYLYEGYEKIEDYTPGEAHILEFIWKMKPVMERVFERSMDINVDTNKLAKYIPQDHKKSTKRR